MRLLLDTHIVLWELAGVRRIAPRALHAIDHATELYVSVVSFAEIGVKAAIGKLTVPPDFYAEVSRSGLSVLRLDADQCLAVADLPVHHRDPFDRLIIAQARSEQLTIVTADPRMNAYDVTVIDAA